MRFLNFIHIGLILGLVHTNAGADEIYRMEIADYESMGMQIFIPGQKLTLMEAPVPGLPQVRGSRTWYLQAQLGDGENNLYPMAASIPDDGGLMVWIVDSNQNQDLSDDKILVKRFKVSARSIEFPTLDLTISAGGKKTPFRAKLCVRGLGRPEPSFTLKNLYCRMGEILLGGDKYEAALVDNNSNGLFIDTHSGFETQWRMDKLFIAKKLKGAGYEDYLWESSVWTVILDGVWRNLAPTPDGAQLHVKGIEEDRHPLYTNFKSFNLEFYSHQRGFLNLRSDNGKILLPPGKYFWTSYTVDHRFDNGSNWSFISGTLMNKPFTIKPGENRLDLCVPLRLELDVIHKGDVIVFEEQLKGRHNENIYPLMLACFWGLPLYITRMPAPSFVVEDTEGRVVGSGRFEAG